MAGQRVGDLNGKWAFMFKTGVVVLPVINACFLPWAIWVTTTLWDCSAAAKDGDKVLSRIDLVCKEHQADMAFMRAEFKEVDQRLDGQPPEVWKQKIGSIEADMRRNSDEHANIMVSLEVIKQRLGVQPDVASGN
jgi:hypothetical protein